MGLKAVAHFSPDLGDPGRGAGQRLVIERDERRQVEAAGAVLNVEGDAEQIAERLNAIGDGARAGRGGEAGQPVSVEQPARRGWGGAAGRAAIPTGAKGVEHPNCAMSGARTRAERGVDLLCVGREALGRSLLAGKVLQPAQRGGGCVLAGEGK